MLTYVVQAEHDGKREHFGGRKSHIISLIFIIIVIITFTFYEAIYEQSRQRQKGKKQALIFDCSTQKDYLSAVRLKSKRRLEPH